MTYHGCLGGDFNEILFGNEKEGGNLRPQRCMQAFRDVLRDCNLDDLGYIGDDFTWRRGRIRERLDRVVSNGSISTLFPHIVVVHEEFSKSDHRPLVLDNEFYAGPQTTRPSGLRRFEARWLREESVDSIVKAAWVRAKSRPGTTLAEAERTRMSPRGG